MLCLVEFYLRHTDYFQHLSIEMQSVNFLLIIPQ